MDAPEPEVAEDTQPEAIEAPAQPDTPEPQHDYEKRYNDLRSEFDRRNEELKLLEQLRSDDPNVYSNALKELGFGGDEPEDEPIDEDAPPWAHVEKELAALKAEREAEKTAIEQEIRRQQEVDHVERSLAELEKEHGEFTEKEVQLLATAANALRGEDGLPNLKAAFDLYSDGLTNRSKKWIESKKAPHVPSGGQSANPSNPNLDNEAERQAWIVSRLGGNA